MRIGYVVHVEGGTAVFIEQAESPLEALRVYEEYWFPSRVGGRVTITPIDGYHKMPAKDHTETA